MLDAMNPSMAEAMMLQRRKKSLKRKPIKSTELTRHWKLYDRVRCQGSFGTITKITTDMMRVDLGNESSMTICRLEEEHLLEKA